MIEKIKMQLNAHLEQSHANGLTYEDLFTKHFSPEGESYHDSRVKHTTISQFEEELKTFIDAKKTFIIYCQVDDADFFAAECCYTDYHTDIDELEEQNTPKFTVNGTTIYVQID